ncbi:MAG: biopolymer transporter ExbD [Bacteroidetes bacterium]|nr:MAG: biopolymer transporter ExbD [Bacteroidota bacterium]
MSGASGGLSAPERIKRGKHSKRKKRKRIGFALDMTPLVDITFLLLTFFMFTTTMAAPQVMEMSMPPEGDVKIEVRENELMTLRLRDDGKLFFNMANDEPKPVEIKDLRKIAETENLRPEIQNKLITVFKVSEDAKYGDMVKVLDELNLAEIKISDVLSQKKDEKGEPVKRKRKFTLAPLDTSDLRLIKGL